MSFIADVLKPIAKFPVPKDVAYPHPKPKPEEQVPFLGVEHFCSNHEMLYVRFFVDGNKHYEVLKEKGIYTQTFSLVIAPVNGRLTIQIRPFGHATASNAREVINIEDLLTALSVFFQVGNSPEAVDYNHLVAGLHQLDYTDRFLALHEGNLPVLKMIHEGTA